MPLDGGAGGAERCQLRREHRLLNAYPQTKNERARTFHREILARFLVSRLYLPVAVCRRPLPVLSVIIDIFFMIWLTQAAIKPSVYFPIERLHRMVLTLFFRYIGSAASGDEQDIVVHPKQQTV